MRIYLQAILFVPTFLLASILIPNLPTLTNLQLTPSAIAAPSTQSQYFLDELEIIHRTNLIRREQGLPPLRWNRELHKAARWFAEDAITGRERTYCGHEDSLERSPGERFAAFGYRNLHAWSENVICGLTSPQNAVNGWMNSEGHRRNLLSAAYREIGVGYYKHAENNKGYIVQEFAYDPAYAPVIIENEAPSVTSPQVQIYIYNTESGEGFRGMSPAIEMMLANEPNFTEAEWQPYASEVSWQLEAGEGWRTVYVKTRDEKGRTTTVFDTIYVGETIPTETLTLDRACTFHTELELASLDTSGWPQLQLSLNWQGDNSDATFEDANGLGSPVDDGNAVGGNAHFVPASAGAGQLRYWTTSFHKDMALMAYFRVKTTANSSSNALLNISVSGGGTKYGPLEIKGTDFASTDGYQEFALPLRFHNNPDNPYLIFNFDITGESDIFIDTITLFTDSMPLTGEVAWPVPSGYHRSRGVWARFVQSDGVFSAATELELYGDNTDVIPAIPATIAPAPVATVLPDSPLPTATPSPTPTPEAEQNIAQSFTIYLPIAMR